jgi:hypothetical protein
MLVAAIGGNEIFDAVEQRAHFTSVVGLTFAAGTQLAVAADLATVAASADAAMPRATTGLHRFLGAGKCTIRAFGPHFNGWFQLLHR